MPQKCLGQSQSVPIGAVRASDKPNPAGEALKKARTTEIPQDSCCPSLGWVKSAPIRAIRAADGACGKVLGLSSAQRVLRHPFIVIPARRRCGRIQFQFLPERVFADERTGRYLIAAATGRFGDEADVERAHAVQLDGTSGVHKFSQHFAEISQHRVAIAGTECRQVGEAVCHFLCRNGLPDSDALRVPFTVDFLLHLAIVSHICFILCLARSGGLFI